MQVKNNIIENFQNTKMKKEQSSKVFGINFTWEFASLFEIISKPKFLKYLNMKYKNDFKNITLSKFNEITDELRSFIKQVDQTLWDYLLEIKNDKIIYNIYEEFLVFVYSSSKDFINDVLIEQIIFWNESLEIIQLNNKNFDSEKYFQFNIEKFKLNFQKFIFKKIKALLKEEPHNQVIGIVFQAYEQNIKDKEFELVNLKKLALIE
ncbi:hypothetical protein CK556_02260 [Mesoplasma chauliocola]|uniref:Uncharacterized protein n=1 Tax=Mesoplasma chauliocola TaxID=216427 RepID=A0A249SNI5_9MOLU|nr:hypothetical protein [Mesoplasma chauliocola]ASZ09172.1 hypothetical protein CK556_02260 [Mesoplasma chauliocola]